MIASALAQCLVVREALLGATVLGHDVVSQKMRTLRNYCPNLRFDVEGEEDTNNNPRLYGFLVQFASDL